MSPRRTGILLHPTSFAGPGPIGRIGGAVEPFLDWLVDAGIGLWQMLPLGPPAAGNSPFSPASVHAGNPLLIAPELLRADRLIDGEPAAGSADTGAGRTDFAAAAAQSRAILELAWERLPGSALADSFKSYREREAEWLADWALFSALKEAHGGAAWTTWPSGLRERRQAALDAARIDLGDRIGFHEAVQFLFDRQWTRLRQLAAEREIRLLGDVPIYPAHDSADVWSSQGLFRLDAAGQPQAVAGVPGDHFNPNGQLWGNPLYRWEAHRDEGFAWWVRRLTTGMARADLLRLDHFRGLVACWEVPAGAATAAAGQWSPVPGDELLAALAERASPLPLVAEDLGVITPDVDALRNRWGLPGTRVLQFAFDEGGELHRPHSFAPRTVVYTGTHDNDTTRGWLGGLRRADRSRVLEYVGGRVGGAQWSLIRAALTSVAELAVLPAQDVLGLPSAARMNRPGEADGNWRWRLRPGQLGPKEARRLRRLNAVSGRLPPPASANVDR